MTTVKLAEPTIKTKAAFAMIGLVKTDITPAVEGGETGIGKLWDTFFPRMVGLAMMIAGDVWGVSDNFRHDPHTFDYLAGVEVWPDAKSPSGMVRWDVPAQTYAVFEAKLSQVTGVYDYIQNEWLPNSSYAHTMGPELEQYDESFNPEKGNDTYYIWIPVKEK